MGPIKYFLESQISERSVKAVLDLLENGSTVPFIARYRKEKTGSLDETLIREIENANKKLKELEQRKLTILKAIEEQGQLNEALHHLIINCYDSVKLEDIYLPFKKGKKTKADVARENGLEGLAKMIMAQGHQIPEDAAQRFIGSKISSIEEALEGARHIIAEWINTDTFLRDGVRQRFERHATIRSKVKRGKKEEGQKFKDYFDFEERLSKCPSHRFLAIMRGVSENILQVQIRPDEDRTIDWICQKRIKGRNPSEEQIELAIVDAYKRLMAPSIENQVQQQFKEKADKEAIEVFAENLEQLLMAPPLGERSVLALDPGFRTGCKLVCLDQNGTLLHHTTIFPHPPQNDHHQSLQTVAHCLKKYGISAIAIGDGTAGRETLDWLKGSLSDEVDLYQVNESGASIYSASDVAREEFPHLDLTVRGSISIGRRLMDPLAELIKIDPKSIGVGQYQHDVHQTKLSNRLDQVVVSTVNKVGVNLNTASAKLLSYISGLGPGLAQNIVEFRRDEGPFESRSQLKKVPRLGPKAFEQCSGFLRLREGANPLDNTAVHPESYPIVKKMAKSLNVPIDDLIGNKALIDQLDLQTYATRDLGMPTLKDIISELTKPGLDVRGEVENISFRDDVKEIEDLYEGMKLTGLVKNITNFGAFVDIGIKEAGLVHVSEISNTFIQHPSEKLKLNQRVEVKVIGLDLPRKRIQLSIKQCV